MGRREAEHPNNHNTAEHQRKKANADRRKVVEAIRVALLAEGQSFQQESRKESKWRRNGNRRMREEVDDMDGRSPKRTGDSPKRLEDSPRSMGDSPSFAEDSPDSPKR